MTATLRTTLPCPMCDGTEITTTFHIGASYWGDRNHCAYGGSANGWVSNRRDKHLHYRCETCRYDWTGDTAEAANSQERPA